MSRLALTFALVVVALSPATSAGPRVSQSSEEAMRRLSRVPAPVGPQSAPQELYTGSYALLVGVSRYDTSSAWASLESIPGELDQLADALRAGGFDRVEQLKDPTGLELRRGVEDFIGKYGYVAGHRLVFFFSGHGYTLDRGTRGYFVPRDAPDPLKDEAAFRSVALSMQQVSTWAQDLVARHALFSFDSCFSGTIFRTRERLVPPRISEMTSKPVREFMSAGGAGEPVPARSVYTPIFIRGLKGDADLDKDGYVTGTELGNYVQREVITYRTRQTPQFGKIRDPDLDEGDIVFAIPAPASAPPAAPAGVPLPAALLEGQRQCDAGVAKECYRLALAFQNGDGIVPDLPRAVALYLRGCDIGDVGSCTNAGVYYSLGRGVSADPRRAASLFLRGCDGGDFAACLNLAGLYERGSGVPQDLPRAVSVYQRGCDGGHPGSCSNLGRMYEFGRGVAADLKRAATLYLRACEAGSAAGCTVLGDLHEHGKGVTKDASRAVSLYQRGCDGGDADGCLGLGVMYELGTGVAADLQRAATFYRRACDGRNQAGCTNLGILYESGRGVAADLQRAATFFRQGCDAGSAGACTYLAEFHEHGKGVTKDIPRAIALYRRGCDGKDEGGCSALKRLEGK